MIAVILARLTCRMFNISAMKLMMTTLLFIKVCLQNYYLLLCLHVCTRHMTIHVIWADVW